MRQKTREARVQRADSRPEAVRYPNLQRVIEDVGTPSARWKYLNLPSAEAIWVLSYERPDGSNRYKFVKQNKDGWFIEPPRLPYPLFDQQNLVDSKTVYVCGSEKAANAGGGVGLETTTSMCGPHQAAKSDWSPLEDKCVVILPDLNEDGMKYAEEVAQLALAAGAYSVKIVTLPRLNDGEGVVEWIGDQQGDEDEARIHAEIAALVEAAPTIERQATADESYDLRTELQSLSEIAPESRGWIVDGVIPCGALTLITGERSVGKSLFMLDVAACVTSGKSGLRGAVMLFSAIDDPASTIRPRLEAAGGNLSRLYWIKGPGNCVPVDGRAKPSSFRFDRDLSRLEIELQRLRDEATAVRLIVFDPIESFLEREASGMTLSEAASRLSDLAARTGVAIVVVSASISPSAGGGNRRSRHTADGEAMMSTARSVWNVVRDPHKSKRRMLMPVKTNLSDADTALRFSIQAQASKAGTVGVPQICDFERVPNTPDPKKRKELFRAVAWLQERLSKGRVRSTTIKIEADESGFADVTLRRAYHWLGGRAVKEPVTKNWVWRLPDDKSSASADSDEGRIEDHFE